MTGKESPPIDRTNALSMDLIPGTELMREEEGAHLTNALKQGKQLIPCPSNDPADPLNWSKPWKCK
ncbi:hypothetical protein N7541_005140 [Penicillium brevicompactum]|uniref:Uncharacterized protein n=1 Tax=Penicillium brevicompactum TaxID=5074 RepID=A0A9W9RCY8_PENBR|nr:hypothetical protein N7541_005140 [Penicillium brevicompactum]